LALNPFYLLSTLLSPRFSTPSNPLTPPPSDHFEDKVEASLRRDLPIITTPHAKTHLADSKSPEEAFTAVHDLDFFQDMFVDIQSSEGGEGKRPALKVTGMPGKHVPPGVLGTLNDLINAVGVCFFPCLCAVLLLLLCRRKERGVREEPPVERKGKEIQRSIEGT